MNCPLVTIITPTYCHESYIGECIESVLAQTYENWEQIIVDDCSSDRTVEIARRYNDPRIRIVQKSIRGGPEDLHTSYNTALKMARGDLIAVLEGDDYWPDDKLSIQVPVHSEDIVVSWGLCSMNTGGVIQKPRRRWRQKARLYPNLSTLLTWNTIPAVTVVIRKPYLQRMGGFWQPEGAMLVDHPTWLRLRRQGKFLFIPAMLGVWRRHAGQITQSYEMAITEAAIRYVPDFFDELSASDRGDVNLRDVEAGQLLRRASLAMQKGNRADALRIYLQVLANGSAETRWFTLKLLAVNFRSRT